MSDSTLHIVVVGGGQAGADCVNALRQQGFSGRLSLIGDEPRLPYRRPPLSKACLLGQGTLDSLSLRPASAYEKLDVEVRTGQSVEHLDRKARQLQLLDGSQLGYDRLVLATGSRARRWTLAGGDRRNVHYLRTAEDLERLLPDWQPGRRLVIIGGGYIGLEVAAAARQHGLDVTVVESQPRLLARVAPPLLSDFYLQLHRDHGVEFALGQGVSQLLGEPDIKAVELSDGRRLDCDLVVVGIGSIPNTGLATESGLEVNDGIVVDASMQTSDASIWAIGDCCRHFNTFYQTSLRLESVPAAQEQAKVAAAAIMGKPLPVHAVPWFWSEQYDVKLQMIGQPVAEAAQVLRGDPAGADFSLCQLQDGRVVAAATVNRAQEFVALRRLVGERLPVDATVLADPDCSLKNLLPAAVA
ncbi:NAD(P)/FAD-dependent oxidoreductase [Frateuria aurantia]